MTRLSDLEHDLATARAYQATYVGRPTTDPWVQRMRDNNAAEIARLEAHRGDTVSDPVEIAANAMVGAAVAFEDEDGDIVSAEPGPLVRAAFAALHEAGWRIVRLEDVGMKACERGGGPGEGTGWRVHGLSGIHMNGCHPVAAITDEWTPEASRG